MTMKELLALPAEAQATGAHMVSTWSMNIDQGHHSAELALPTLTTKDSKNGGFITIQTHAKKFSKHCCPHGPLIT